MLQDTYGGRVRVPKEKGAPWSKLHRRGRVRVVDSGAILSGVREGGRVRVSDSGAILSGGSPKRSRRLSCLYLFLTFTYRLERCKSVLRHVCGASVGFHLTQLETVQ